MVLVLGVSAGASGARAIVAHADQPHQSPLDHCFVPRRPGGCVGEPVVGAVDRLRAAAAARGERVTAVAVTYRSEVHADAIRGSGLIDRGIPTVLVKESTAQLRYLRFVGKLPKTGSIVLYDLGSSGLTVTLADSASETVLRTRRSTVLGGDEYDGQVQRRLAHEGVSSGLAECRGYKESLSATKLVTVPTTHTDDRIVLTRNDVADLQAAGIHHSVSFIRHLVDDATQPTEAVALLGGCTRNPLVRDRLEATLKLPMLVDDEPELVSARGALVLAGDRRARLVRAVKPADQAKSTSRRKLVAALAVTAGLTATIAGFVLADNSSSTPEQSVPEPSSVQIAGVPDRPW